MRHAARRPRRLRSRHRRFIWATFSTLTLVVALLGAVGLLPFAANTVSTAADIAPESRMRTLADRSRPDLSPRTSVDPNAGPSPSVKAAERTPRPAADAEEALPAGTGTVSRVVYALSANRVWLVRGRSTVVRTYAVSGTKYGQLDPGRYEVIRKRRHTTSYHGTERMEYMVTFTFGANAAIGFHDIPVSIETGERVQTVSQLGRSLSDGCVRQATSDARALWSFTTTGTPVVVVA
jgi:lipoprotein-anchoring transpeptidase ErfK/SrfK